MPETLPSSLRARFKQAPDTQHGFAFHRDTDVAVMQALEALIDQVFGVRINVWYGNATTGQSFGHSRAALGVYVKAEQEREHGVAPFRVVRLTKRLGADQSYDLPAQNVVMISTADGKRIFWKHPTYRPEFDWSRARLHHEAGDDAEMCIYAPLYGELDERLAHGQLTQKAAAQFLKVARLTDVPQPPSPETS